MKKIVKILLFVMLLFVATKVNAADYMKFDAHAFRQYTELNINGFSIKTANDIYAFCLDKNYQFSNTGITYEDFNEGHFTAEIKEYKVRNVLVKAYSDGLGTGSNVYGLDDEEFYAVTQMAVWYVAHHNDDNGYDTSFDAFLDAKTARREAFNKMILTENIPEYTYSKNITFANDSYSLTLNDNDEYETEEIKFNAPSLSTYKVTASKGACVVYGNDCKSEVQIKSGESFKLRAANDGSKEMTVSATIKSTSKVFNDYDFAMYMPVDYYGHAYVNSDGTPNLSEDLYNVYGEKWVKDGERVNNGVQRMGYLVPKYGEVSATLTAKAVVEDNSKAPVETKKVDIKICGLTECDVESNVIISEITESGSTQLYDLIIKNGEPYNISVKVGSYYVLRNSIEFPKTGDMAGAKADAIYFKVTEDGVKLCSIKNHDLSKADCDIASDIFKTNGFEISIDNCTDKKEPETIAFVGTPEDTEVLESKTINNVPSTGVNTKAYLIGSLVMLAGAGTVVIAKKKENM